MIQEAGSGETMALPQGDLRLLEGDVAKHLLASTVPARLAFVWTDGTPRVVPTWFHWTGEQLGEEAAADYLAQVDQPGTRMARIGVRPTWVGVLDFETRLPSALGGVTGRGGRDG
jgi:hypothetical protein